ncbi:hypothetical protein [Parvularcula sp. LCG005]|uniref:hypothetical protein n=1 Tax=Parvularcula sp. LCG005 TaxID=3078805 RepID=UPI002943E694|nr:hypothetical protein [Parvularcula sp. LCG005]WOI54182.1 hypothetical protein RUI03_04090 [Parvularcula sp. LCG005]
MSTTSSARFAVTALGACDGQALIDALTRQGNEVTEAADHHVILIDRVPDEALITEWKERFRGQTADITLTIIHLGDADAERHAARYEAEQVQTMIAYLAVELAYHVRACAICLRGATPDLWDDTARTVAFVADCTGVTGQLFRLPDPMPGSVAVG